MMDREEMWNELLRRGREQGINNPEAYHELVDDYLEERLEVGESHDDQNLIELATEFKSRWQDFAMDLGIA